MHPENIKLASLAKKMGAKIWAVQETLVSNSRKSEFYIDKVNAYTKFPQWLPLFIRYKLVWLRKWIGHIYYYWTLRAGKSSRILRRGCSGMRDADIQTYLCEEQKKIFLENGVPESKLIYNPFFVKKPKKPLEKIITILVPSENEGGIDRITGEFIPYQKQLERWIALSRIIVEKYPKYEIYFKFHPNTKNYDNYLAQYFKGLCFKDRKWAGLCIDKASIIIGLPPSFSTLLYQASVEYPWKKIISLDIGNEMFGDYFKGYKNIKVITDINKLWKMI